MDPDKVRERELLINRFLKEDLVIYRLAKELGVEIASKYDGIYERHLKLGQPFYIFSDDRKVLVSEIARKISDEKLLEVFNELKPKSWLDVGFRGRYYTYEEGEELRLEDGWRLVKKEVLEALDALGERGYAFLKAIINLHEAGKWKGDYYGAKYDDIIAEMRKILGRTVFPAPKDFVVLRSYKLYYKSGSKRYPTHSVPEEIIPAVKEALEEWYQRREPK